MSSIGRRGRRSSRDASPSRQSSSHNNPSNGNYRNRSPERKDIENPPCKYGDGCYQLNIEHMSQFSHSNSNSNSKLLHNMMKILLDTKDFTLLIPFIRDMFKDDDILKSFIIYSITKFDDILQKYNNVDNHVFRLIQIYTQFDSENNSRTIKVCDKKQIDIINNKLKGNILYEDINSPERQINKGKGKGKDCIHIVSSLVLILLHDYQKQQLKVQEHKTPGGKRESYKRKSYKRESYKKNTYKRKTYKKKNKKIRSVKNRRI